MRKLRLLAHYLFDWRVYPAFLDYPVWKGYCNPLTPKNYQTPRWLGLPQRWIWRMQGQNIQCWKRVQFVRSIVDNQF